jgi:hypothetical protein
MQVEVSVVLRQRSACLLLFKRGVSLSKCCSGGTFRQAWLQALACRLLCEHESMRGGMLEQHGFVQDLSQDCGSRDDICDFPPS